MKNCETCDFYNCGIGRCMVTRQKKETTDSCDMHQETDYIDYDWEH